MIVVGWDLSDSLERHSTIKASNKALLRRKPEKGLRFTVIEAFNMQVMISGGLK